MAIFKCKMCGGTLEIKNNETVAVCEYCGTKQTLPKLDDDRKANLYDRANHFRRNNEFDKAMGIYEQILNDDNTDAESYWSLVLCRYGIEYVEDPTTHKRIPTVNRTQFTSIFDDEDYKSALQYADGYQKEVYEQEANAINDIQKGILAISQKEDPFDVFICYKETDNSGLRSPDSVLATELYNELTREGFKVFFARITLEDKLGQEYEPYIFAALNSAKVMVVLGTKPEYFNAVWVKNEWSRYLALIKNGARKMLIPAYKDMDPYDLPEEFSHLQAQDMSKLGFMQDLIRGIKKIVGNNTDKPIVHETIISNEATGNVMALLKRGYIALEDGEWKKADDFFEQCLNQNAELAEAYLGKLMAELQVKTKDGLKDCVEPFEDRSNYQKTIRFANNKLKAFLVEVIQFINKRNEDTAHEEVYNRACNLMNLNNEGAYIEAAQWFTKVPGYKDADIFAEECREKAEVARKDRIYEKANLVLVDNGIKKYNSADFLNSVKTFESILDWKDSNEKAELCKQKAAEIIAQEKAYVLECERKAEEERLSAKKRNKKIAIITTPIVWAIIAFIIVLNTVIIPNAKYNDAVALMNAKKYEEAISKFETLEGYKDSKDKITASRKMLLKNLISLSDWTLGVTKQGKVLTTKLNTKYFEEYDDGSSFGSETKNYGQCNVEEWTNIVSVATGCFHSVGLRTDGTVCAVGDNSYGQCNVENWSGIVAIDASLNATFGLKYDGTVVGVGENSQIAKPDEWHDIVKIDAGAYHGLIGLRTDGTVVFDGSDYYKQDQVKDWKDIIDVGTDGYTTVGLKKDGTVVAIGNNRNGQCNIKNWDDIKSINVCNSFVLGLRNDGKVNITNYIKDDNDGYFDKDIPKLKKIEKEVRSWTDIIGIFCSIDSDDIIGLKSDGTLVSAGFNHHGSGNVNDWDLF